MKKLLIPLISAACMLGTTGLHATSLMSAEWAAQACESFNSNEILTNELGTKWIKNDGSRGYKIIHMYRTECGENTRVEMKIIPNNGKAQCAYGGEVKYAKLDSSMDYVMHAKTEYWREMGAGDYGPMRAMFTRALRFDGPKFEAMSVMGPFQQFLLLPGKVAGDDTCPK